MNKGEIDLQKTIDIILLQSSIVILSFSAIFAKKASCAKLFSCQFWTYYVIEIMIIGIYALVWQQIIKKFDISVAYSNKGSLIIWTFIWAVLIFHEKITTFNLIGAVIIIAGIVLVLKNAK